MAAKQPLEPDSSGAPRELRFAIANDIGLVGGANETLETFLLRLQLKPDVVCCTVLALEEAITNIIRYAYADDGSHEILIEARVGEGEVVLRITDDGEEFDILSASPPHMHLPIEERPPGGLGIHLLRSLARRIEYERADGRNKLILFIALDP